MSESNPTDVTPAIGGATAVALQLPEPVLARCLNCGATLAGSYCSACGQKHEPHIHSIGHFISEAAENITHADSRLWRTLGALLAKPGFLTREFFDGRRARYMPPVRLYLVLSVVFFLIAGFLPHDGEYMRIDQSDLSGASAKAAPQAKPAAGAPAAAVVAPKTASAKPAPAAPDAAADDDVDDAATAERKERSFCANIKYAGPWPATIQPRLREGCSKAFADKGRGLVQALLHNLPRALFVLLPLIALFMRVMYWIPRRHYVEHLLLLVHNHAFLFLVFGTALLVGRLPWEWPSSVMAFVLTFYLPWYFYKSLRVYYGQGRMLTLGKFALLSLIYLTVALATLAITALISVATL